MVEAERAERARAAGDAAALHDAMAVGRGALGAGPLCRGAGTPGGVAHDVHLRGWHAKAEAEWTRLQGHSDPKAWQAAVEAFSYGHVYAVARCQWRLAEALLGGGRPGTGDRQPPGRPIRRRCELGAEPLQARWRRWPAGAASTLALAYRPSGPWPA